MAKQAKAQEVEISDKDGRKFLADIFARLENIESARGTFMNRARREREGMVAIYEEMAGRGFSQKISKLIVKIAVADEKIRGWQSELEEEEKKIAVMLAHAVGGEQLSFWDDEPKQPKQPKQRKPKKSNVVPMTPELSESVA